MTLAQIADLMGWMLLINIVLLIIGYLKITVFKGLVKRILNTIMGEQSELLYATIPKALVHFEILIVVFNFTPYLALRIIL